MDREENVLTVKILSRLGLDRRELRAWAMYDWANSAFQTTIITAVFPDFFAAVAAADLAPAIATARYAWATTIAVGIVAVMGPILGAIADYRALKKRMLGAFMAIGVVATLMMATIDRGEWAYASIVFIVANVCIAASFVFYDSLLPHIARPDEMDRVSTAAYAMGYLGGGLLLVINLLWILMPTNFGIPDTITAIRLSFVSVAIWWLVFSIPLFRDVREPAPALEQDETGAENPVHAAFVRLRETFQELRGYRQAFLMLVAFLLYNDGIQTIIRMATIYGAEIGIDRDARIAAFVVVQFVGVPFSFLFGAIAARIGAKTSIFVALTVYTAISILGYFMTSAWQFFVLAFLVGTVQGGSQALSRSLFARMIPKHKSSEYFGFFSVFEKFAGVAGPALFAGSVTLFGSSRAAVLSVILFFVAGALVLTRVDVAEGEAQAHVSV
ncbi:MAG TPA: MFS transporter [Vicinamibacterales bacterium]|jgi:UMF1 family MFS transporter|nr:MFS transporter [Vicinamibacterales bacterium]